MDGLRNGWYFPAMTQTIPSWQLYGEKTAFPDILHVERVIDRAAGLDWTIEPHRHLHLHQLFLLTSGQIALTIDGTPRPVTLPAVINIPRGTVHGFSFSAGTEGLVLTLPADDFPDLFAAPAETAAALSQVFAIPATPPIIHRFHSLDLHHACSSPTRRTFLRGEVSALIAEVTEIGMAGQGQRVTIDPRIQRLEALVRAGISRRFSLDDLAEALAMSPRTLARLCKAHTGLTVQGYVEAQKMREACRLLVYTRMTAQQIAYHLGYDDPAYFSRVFQRALQISPTAYRRRFDG
jgi:AraC family transcriptional activator of pobA